MLWDVNWFIIFILVYCFGGVLNYFLGSVIYEIGYNLVFGYSCFWVNRLFSIWCNFLIVVFMVISYKKYY